MTNTEYIIAVTISLAAVTVIFLLVLKVQSIARKSRLRTIRREGKLDAYYRSKRSNKELFDLSYDEYSAYLGGYKDQLEEEAPKPDSDAYIIGKARAAHVQSLRDEFNKRVSEEKGGKQRR